MTADPHNTPEFAAHMVELCATDSAHDARATAELLRRHGIAAIANATPVQLDPTAVRRGRRDFRTFVMVLEADLQRARAVLDAQFASEGPVSIAEIEAEFAADAIAEEEAEEAEEDDDAVVEPWWVVWLFRGFKACFLALAAAAVYRLLQ